MSQLIAQAHWWDESRSSDADASMKLLFVTAYYKPAYVYGGPTRSISALCEGLASVGAEVTVLTTNANGPSRLDVPINQEVQINGVKVWYHPLALGGQYFYSPALVEAVKRQVAEFDLVVNEVFLCHAFAPTASACMHNSIPYVIPTRGQLLPWALNHKRLKKQLYLRLIGWRYLNRAAAFHCTDEGEKLAISRLGMHPPVFVVPNGIDTSQYDHVPPRGRLRRQFNIPETAILLLFLGRLNRVKGPDITVDVLAELKKTGHEAHLVLAGPDEQQLTEALRAQAERLGCLDRVHFAGLLTDDDTRQAFADADLLLMPSQVQENFGMSAVEAMAAGVPVLVSAGVPVGKFAEEAQAGRVTGYSREAFIVAAQNLLQTPATLRTMGQRARALARERFDNTAVAYQMLAHLEVITKKDSA